MSKQPPERLVRGGVTTHRKTMGLCVLRGGRLYV
jgi:hypothetical protein